MNLQFDFNGRTAFVTGAASGVGRATALAFATAGAWVWLVDLEKRSLQDTLGALQQHGGQGAAVACDVRHPQAVQAAVDGLVRERGRLDFAVNAAGVEGAPGALLTESDELFNQVIDVNLRGVWNCMRAQIGPMVAQGGGAIVNVSSAAGLVGSLRCAAYSASKHGVIGLTRSAALQYARQGVRINAVCPAGVETPMARRIVASVPAIGSGGGANYPLGRYSTPEEIAASILWLCSEGGGSAIGTALSVDAGFTAA